MDNVIEKGHLCYEIRMLTCCYHRLRYVDRSDSVLKYALFESFCMHARNLFEFLKEQPNNGGAKRYAPSYYLSPATYKDDVSRLNNQITHMLADRTTDKAELLDETDLYDMLKKLDGEIARFRAELDEASRELVPDVSSFIAVQPMPPGTRFTTTADSEIVTVGNIFSCA